MTSPSLKIKVDRESSNSTTEDSSPNSARQDQVLDELRSLLRGEGLPRDEIEAVDGLLDNDIRNGPNDRGHHHRSNEAGDAKNPVILNRSVAYVVGVICLDRGGTNVLMIQEAKSECRGLWYLPAGRAEFKEKLEDAAKRETLEEAGLNFIPKTLVAIEMSHRGWFRFIFSGEIEGGRLKTTAESDNESLQASWLSIDSMMKRSDKQHHLRCTDILWLMEVVPDVVSAVIREQRAPGLLPIPRGRDRMYLCCALAFREESNFWVLGSVNSGRHIPVCLISSRDWALYSPLDRLLKDVWKKDSPVISYEPIGLLAVEHNPAESDGILLAVLCLVTTPDRRLPCVRNKNYQWVSVSSNSQHAALSSSLSSSGNFDPSNSSSDLALLLEQRLKKIGMPPVIINI